MSNTNTPVPTDLGATVSLCAACAWRYKSFIGEDKMKKRKILLVITVLVCYFAIEVETWRAFGN